MQRLRNARFVFVSILIVTLCGCSAVSQLSPSLNQQGVSQSADPNRNPSFGSLEVESKAKKATPLIFAADQGGQGVTGAVYAYADSGKGQSPIWSLTSGLKEPAGLWVDGSGDLYVGDAAGFVYEYTTPTASGPPAKVAFTYSNDGIQMNHVAACGKYLYASDPSVGSQEYAAFTVWQIGTEKPLRIVYASIPSSTAGGITCDAKTGDIYFMYNASYFGPATLYEYPADGSGSGKQLLPSPYFDAGLTFNQTYTLLVLGDNFNMAGPAIEFWKPGKKATRQFINPPDTWIGDPVEFAYEKGDGELWDADTGNKALYRFKPGNGMLENTITSAGGGKSFNNLSGVAVSPADHP